MKKIYVITAILLCLAGQTMKAQVPQLWGLTYNCGDNNCGSIIKINEDGSYFETMYSFDTLTGMNPSGSLLMASDGKLYGVCINGGTDTNHYNGMMGAPGAGVIFSFDPIYHIYTDLFNFNLINGLYPNGPLIQLSNGKLYGTTNYGGVDTNGNIFSFDPVNLIFTDLFDFTNITHGINPRGSLIQAINGRLYGFAGGGDTSTYQNGLGVIFSLDTSNNTYADLYDFELLTGAGPDGNLIQANNGKLYGLCNNGGDTVGNGIGRGVIFSFDPSTNIYSDLHNDTFPLASSSLIQAANGKLYGTNISGDVFSFDISTDSLLVIYDYSAILNTSLVQGSNGTLYGADEYHIFGLDTTGMNSTILNNFSPICSIYGAFIELPANTGIQQLQKQSNEVTVYPNPASSSLNIQLSSLEPNETLQITDVLGRKIEQQVLSGITTSLDVSKWSEGVYFYQITDNKESYRGKFIKLK